MSGWRRKGAQISFAVTLIDLAGFADFAADGHLEDAEFGLTGWAYPIRHWFVWFHYHPVDAGGFVRNTVDNNDMRKG